MVVMVVVVVVNILSYILKTVCKGLDGPIFLRQHRFRRAFYF